MAKLLIKYKSYTNLWALRGIEILKSTIQVKLTSVYILFWLLPMITLEVLAVRGSPCCFLHHIFFSLDQLELIFLSQTFLKVYEGITGHSYLLSLILSPIWPPAALFLPSSRGDGGLEGVRNTEEFALGYRNDCFVLPFLVSARQPRSGCLCLVVGNTHAC